MGTRRSWRDEGKSRDELIEELYALRREVNALKRENRHLKARQAFAALQHPEVAVLLENGAHTLVLNEMLHGLRGHIATLQASFALMGRVSPEDRATFLPRIDHALEMVMQLLPAVHGDLIALTEHIAPPRTDDGAAGGYREAAEDALPRFVVDVRAVVARMLVCMDVMQRASLAETSRAMNILYRLLGELQRLVQPQTVALYRKPLNSE